MGKFDAVKALVARNYAKAGVVVGTVMLSAPAMALSQPDVSEEVSYIEGLMSGAGFEIASAGLALTIGIRGLKRIRGAF